jgi:DNA-binding HxlR family transcriptional regulator
LPTKAKKAKEKFLKLLDDVDSIDTLVLRIFPSVDYTRDKQESNVATGKKTSLRILLVAVEKGYVNNYTLEHEYGVGGYSKDEFLPRLKDAGLLRRSKEMSEKKRPMYKYTLADKGVILAAAFPRILRSRQFTHLIRAHVRSESLAQVLLVLHLQPVGNEKNALQKVLHIASEDGLNAENITEEDLANRLLQAEQKEDWREQYLFQQAEVLVDFLHSASSNIIAELSKNASNFVELARSNPNLTKQMLTVAREWVHFVWSPDFLIWARTTKDLTRFNQITLDVVRTHFGKDIQELRANPEWMLGLWKDRQQLLSELRKKLREESFSRVISMETQSLGVKT